MEQQQQQISQDLNALVAFLVLAKRQLIASGAEYGLTNAQAMTLMYIRQDDPQPMSSLCENFSCDASNMTGIIDGLEQKKLVSRQPRPGDRRVKDVRLEPAGARIQKTIAAQLLDKNNPIFSKLTSEQYAALNSLLQIITE